ncbi:YHS domain-containing protein [Planctomicrobium sp. SH664]|uniref:YHS domain-containing protein n=1 Tax=Planctomicrobium sp. SH664 TaxID=3448125 RepID=UPI003F5B85F7
MNHLRCGLTVAVVLVVTLNSASAQTWYTDVMAARRKAEELNRPLLIHFGATWCGPCQQMEKQVLNQPAVLDRLKATVVGLKIDGDKHEDLVQRFGIKSFPTDLIVEPDMYATRIVEGDGFRTLDQYLVMIDRATTRYAELLAKRLPKTTPPVSTTPDYGSDPSQFTNTGKAQLMIEGYCPVTLNKERKWIKGDSQFKSEFKGQLYHFTSAQSRDEFLKTPEKFVPQFLGCDPVLTWTSDRAVPGSIEYGAFYDGKLYLFVSDENRKKFKSEPDKYLTTRVVLYVDQIESVVR